MAEPSSPWVAAFLSFLFPGMGQVYAHDFVKGCILFVIGLGLAIFVFPIGAPLFILLMTRQSWPIAYFIAGVPPEAVEPLVVLLGLLLAPLSWLVWFVASVHAYEVARQHNERYASTNCKICGSRVLTGSVECPKCGAPMKVS